MEENIRGRMEERPRGGKGKDGERVLVGFRVEGTSELAWGQMPRLTSSPSRSIFEPLLG